jgi:hypothetical protein
MAPYGDWLSDIWLELTSLKLLGSVFLPLKAKPQDSAVKYPPVTDTKAHRTRGLLG